MTFYLYTAVRRDTSEYYVGQTGQQPAAQKRRHAREKLERECE
jgi:hypothetical protein